MKKVIIGGTFDILHEGHEALLKKAFELGQVTIGLTSDEMARETKKREVREFDARKSDLDNFIREKFKTEAVIMQIEDKFGLALEEDFDYIVVSPETYPTALQINQKRQELNKNLIEIAKIDFVMAEDGKPVSSSRISNGQINEEGEVL